jgi:hypothetical protein
VRGASSSQITGRRAITVFGRGDGEPCSIGASKTRSLESPLILRGGGVDISRTRTSEPTLIAERRFLSACATNARDGSGHPGFVDSLAPCVGLAAVESTLARVCPNLQSGRHLKADALQVCRVGGWRQMTTGPRRVVRQVLTSRRTGSVEDSFRRFGRCDEWH